MGSSVRKQENLELDPWGARRPNGRLGDGVGTRSKVGTPRARRPVSFEAASCCPTNDSLEAYLKATRLPPRALEAVRLHLVGCPACQARAVSVRNCLNLVPREERRSRLALGFIAGLAAAVALWFGWIYYVELRVERQEALLGILDLQLLAQNLLADAPASQIRLSRGPDRPPALGPLGGFWTTHGGTLWEKRVQMVTRRCLELLQKDPELASELRNVGALLVLAGKPMAASVVLTADGSRPSDPAVLNDLGAARLASGQVTEALADLHEALRLQPFYRQSVYNLAVALETAGERQKAAAQWLEYLAIDPMGHWATHAQRRLAALDGHS